MLGEGGFESHLFGNEQGIELRKQTVDYIELFNETELEDQIAAVLNRSGYRTPGTAR